MLICLSDERNSRFDIFTSNLDTVRRGQFEFDNGLATFDLRINCFSDLNFTEFATQYLGQGQLAGDGPGVFIDPDIDPEQFRKRIVRTGRRDYHSFPSHLDWNQTGENTHHMTNDLVHLITYVISKPNLLSGFVSPVLDQSPCQSCAAHAAVSTIESCLAIASSKENL